ncbi:MAG: metallophosphoesterase [Paludibacteraceae bacterium]|nr:metallophosphoesterase [Paludibacteraceae bacterium]
MRKTLLLLTLCIAVLCASASNRYISPTGNDGDGKSWANAKTSIGAAIWDVGVGDTMFIAEGVYNESVSAQSGATYMGGYNAETGARDPEMYETILDGTDLGTYLIVKYDGDPEARITVDGFILQNANHSVWGGAAMYARGNMTVNNCIFRNCTSGSKAGGIFIDPSTDAQVIIGNCIFEYCNNTLAQQAAAVCFEDRAHLNAMVENCIFRGCQGGVTIYSRAGATIQNCVFYNNQADYNGCLYGKGTFINNTVCNNAGASGRYGGARVDGKVVNTVFWGNKAEGTSSATNQNYIASGAGSSNNIADIGTGMTNGLNSNNTAADGPNFSNPTTFIGVPKTDAERVALQKADFSLTDLSVALINQGDAAQAPATDIVGTARPTGDGVDIGAYEYDPNAVAIAVTGVSILQESLTMSVGSTGTLVAQIEPANAKNKHVTWSIEDETIASMDKGRVTGLKEGTTTAWVETEDGGFKASAAITVMPVKYPKEVLDAEAAYKIEDYTIPSFIPFLVAKQEAKIDSVNPESDVTVIAEKLVVMNQRIAELVGKEEPYNQIATVNGDPATNMAFCWFTNGGITDGVVQLVAKADATAEDFAGAGVITVEAVTSAANLHYTPIQATENPRYDICTAAGLPRNTKFDYVSHKANASNLQPGTAYSWRVGYEGHWSDIAHFVTKETNQGDFSFVYMSDSHIQDAEYIEQALQCAKAVVKNEPDVNFCVFPGDFVDTGGKTNSEWQWERWFASMRPMLNAMTVVPTDGNHDDSPSLNYDYHFNTDWGFANAASVKPQFHGITYSFVYGDVLFLVYSLQDWWRESGTTESVMKSTYITQDIRNWFVEQIAAHPEAKYRVTLSHKNVFSGAGHHLDDECTLLRTLMVPVMKECEIDLAIQGHDHCYEVMGPVDPDTWKVVPGSVADTVRVAPEATGRWERSSNKTGLEGGTFTTDDGTLYFIGATCGRKRYEPYSRYVMDTAYTVDPAKLYDNRHHNVPDLFDLFTTKFGQPGAPSYSRFNVSGEGIEVITYKTDAEGNKEVFNTIKVKRTKPHTLPTGIDEVPVERNWRDRQKFIRNGQIFIRKDGRTFNMLGQPVEL